MSCCNWKNNTCQTSVSVSGTNAIAPIPASLCKLKGGCFIKVSITANTATTQEVFISLCDGTLVPLYLSSTGVQATGADIATGSCYLLYYDGFSSKLFIAG
jgi:hypothetical protein